MAQYIEAPELRSLLSSSPESVFIIDVRDSDHKRGHIRGSRNIPASEFISYSTSRETCQSLLESIRQATSNRDGSGWYCVFHCMESQVRGPKCARIFLDYLKEVGIELEENRVVVLRRGFRGWAHAYIHDKDAIHDLDKEYWDAMIAEDNL